MRLSKTLVRLVSVLTVACMLNSCIYYSDYPVSKDPPPSFEGRMLKLLWPDRLAENIYLQNISFEANKLSGTIFHSETKPYSRQSQVINVYLNPGTAFPDSMPAIYDLPLDKVSKLEVYDVDLGKSVFTTTLLVLGVAATVYLIALLIVIATKTSCPFVYSYNGDDFEFTGEIFSGAIFPGLERGDWMALPHLQAKDGEYQIKIANQAEEIQNINLAELCVVDHPLGTELVADRLGNYYTLRDPQAPLQARTLLGDDVLEALRSRDEVKYMGDNTEAADRAKDGVELSFARPANSASARLVLRARNSLWLDYTMGELLDLFGDSYDKWYAQHDKADKGLGPEWAIQQGIPLSVYLKRDGEWKFVDHFAVIGPMADRDVAMPIDLTGLDSGTVELKLECGARFWEIDSAALDFSPQQKLPTNTLKLSQATDQDGNDVTKLLARDDAKYLTQPRVGDFALLRYQALPARDGMERSVFLRSKGHYKVIRKSHGFPDVAKLQSMKDPSSLGRFSREKYLELKDSYIR